MRNVAENSGVSRLIGVLAVIAVLAFAYWLVRPMGDPPPERSGNVREGEAASRAPVTRP